MPKQPQGPEVGPRLSEAGLHIVGIARERRAVRRQMNAFIELPAESELMAYADPSIRTPDAIAARGLLREVRGKRRKVIRKLPALETKTGEASGVTARQRFESFLNYPILKTLDLQRVEHIDNWDGAYIVDSQTDDLIEFLSQSERFVCEPFALNEDTCVMHLGVIDPDQLSSNLLFLGRNSQKARVLDLTTGDDMFIGKRTEFLLDLDRMNYKNQRYFMNLLSNAPGDATRLEDEDFWFLNALIKDSDWCIVTTNSISYIYRELPELPPDVEPSILLREYPELAQAWRESVSRLRS